MLIKISKCWIVFMLVFVIVNFTLYSQENQTKARHQVEAEIKINREILTLDPFNFATFNNSGNLYWEIGLLDSAEFCYQRAETILDSLKKYYQPIDSAKFYIIQQHYEGVVKNLDIFYANNDLKRKDKKKQGKDDKKDKEKLKNPRDKGERKSTTGGDRGKPPEVEKLYWIR